jgi:HD-GYP domain-containing protein (c-di-GMP phosphodiesterase class II)
MSELAAPGGPAILGALYNGVKTLQLYPADNEAVRRAVADLEAHASRLFEREGGLSIWIAGSYIFLNDLQVKLGLADYASLSALREQVRSHGVGRIDVQPRVREEEWTAFLSALGTDPSPGHPPLESLRARLEADDVRHIQVGPPSPLFEGRDGPESVEAARRTYAYSVKVAKEMMSGLVLGKAIGARRAQRAVLRVVDQVLQDRASMLGMLTLRDYDDHSLIHAVNVSILSVALGDHLGFSKQHLFELGFAALFHDIGKVLIPTGVLNKEGWLNEEEWRLVSQHPDFGLLMLFNVEGFEQPPYRAMLAAYEHHMKTDLSGYPRVIRRRRQGLFARIVALTEAYDAAISRYSKQFLPCSPDEAIRQLRDSESGAYDRVLVRAFVNMMGIYPVATLVILDTGELAVVVAPNPNPRAIHRPMVRIVAGPDGQRLADGPIRDLTEVDPDTGRPRRTIARSTDPQRYGIRVSELVA